MVIKPFILLIFVIGISFSIAPAGSARDSNTDRDLFAFTCEQLRSIIYFLPDDLVHELMLRIDTKDNTFDDWFFSLNESFQQRLRPWLDVIARSYAIECQEKVLNAYPPTFFKKRINYWYFLQNNHFLNDMKHFNKPIHDILQEGRKSLNISYDRIGLYPTVEEVSVLLELVGNSCAVGKIEHIDLGWLKLPAIPPAITKFKRITTLVLSGNHMTYVPDWIGGFKNMWMLFITNCPFLTKLSPSLAQLKNLKVLYVDSNPKLTFLPDLSPCNRLEHVSTCGCHFSEDD